MLKSLNLSSPELAFNARWLTETEVAATFVAPYHFARVARRGHTLIVGPRGSGKTTLLKMLQPAALNVWRAEQAPEIMGLVDYCAAFVPSDVSWSQQIAASLSLGHGVAEQIMQAAFSTSALKSLVETAEWRASTAARGEGSRFLGVKLNRSSEVQLVKEVAAAWGLSLDVQSLLGLRHALRRALLELRSTLREPSATASSTPHPLVTMDLLEAAGFFVEVFNDAVDEGARRWALLFDELEIAPARVQTYLFDALRSSEPKLILKLALSPFNNNVNSRVHEGAPSLGQDYEQVGLWFAQRDPASTRRYQIPFCTSIWNNTLRRIGLPETSPTGALGSSFAADDESEPDSRVRKGPSSRQGYSTRGKRGLSFKALYDSDPTFREYLETRGIEIDQIDNLREREKAQFVRKLAPIVAVREFYGRERRGTDGAYGAGRSRKSAELYTGSESFFTVSEGHPRWLKMTLSRLLESTQGDTVVKISRSLQGAALTNAGHRFNALLSTLPTGASPRSNIRSVHQLVKVVAEFFAAQVTSRMFRAEPPLSFTVDARTPDDLLDALQVAVNIGAFVYMPEGEGDFVLKSLRGKRFRVSYWLAPIYGLPLVSGHSVSLSLILAGGKAAEDDKPMELDLGQ